LIVPRSSQQELCFTKTISLTNTEYTNFGYSIRQQDIPRLTYLCQVLAVQTRNISFVKTWLMG